MNSDAIGCLFAAATVLFFLVVSLVWLIVLPVVGLLYLGGLLS